jgi:hypothetical protein
MIRWSTVAHLVALCLLAVTGVELFACEILPGSICELAGSPLEEAPESGDDNCLCCCFHVIPAVAQAPGVAMGPACGTTESERRGPMRTIPSLELPPRA